MNYGISSLIQNIQSNFSHLSDDFIGLNMDFNFSWMICVNILIVTFLLAAFYSIGEMIRKKIGDNDSTLDPFISIGLGYIAIGSSIALLGLFSILYESVLYVYYSVLFLITALRFYPVFGRCVVGMKSIKWSSFFRKKIVILIPLIFILIGFMRLISPEITEDGYHTDLPIQYLQNYSTLIEPRDPFHVVPHFQLAEMNYIFPILIGAKEAVRFLHFSFYILIVLLLYRFASIKKHAIFQYAPLIFVAAPVVIRYSPTQYIDFFMVYLFLVSVLQIYSGQKKESFIKAGLLFGGVIAIKMWTVVYLPAMLLYLLYLNKNTKKSNLFKHLAIFCSSIFVVVALWYMRDFILTGSPIYPLFVQTEYLGVPDVSEIALNTYFGFNKGMFAFQNLVVLGPLFFLSLFLSALFLNRNLNIFKKNSIFVFIAMLVFEQLFIMINLGRHLLVLFSFLTLVGSIGLHTIINRYRFVEFFITASLIILAAYYFLNTVFIIPYGLGWADKNAYLTRVLLRDNASYYDFGHEFDKHISQDDLVATYWVFNFYYADFFHTDVNYIFDRKGESFDRLQKFGATKLLIKGGDIRWFCAQLTIKDCMEYKAELLVSYPPGNEYYYLYDIKQ